MLLQEINNQIITVRVDQEFSDLTFDFEFDEQYEDISEVPEQLTPLVQVITPIDDDYRGSGVHGDPAWYKGEPELAYYVGKESGKLYQHDLLNDPSTISRLTQITPDTFQRLLQQYIVQHDSDDVGASRLQ